MTRKGRFFLNGIVTVGVKQDVKREFFTPVRLAEKQKIFSDSVVPVFH